MNQDIARRRAHCKICDNEAARAPFHGLPLAAHAKEIAHPYTDPHTDPYANPYTGPYTDLHTDPYTAICVGTGMEICIRICAHCCGVGVPPKPRIMHAIHETECKRYHIAIIELSKQSAS